jgi:hypothetical protein
MLPVLVLGWVFAAVGWWWAPSLSMKARIAWIVISAAPIAVEGYILQWHFRPEDFRTEFSWLFHRNFKSQIPRHAFVHKPAEPKPPPPVVAAPTPPKPPPPPWVTQSEIEEQRKAGHTLLTRSPEELLGLWASSQSVGIYLGKWVKIDYPISSIPTPEKIEKKEYYVVKMEIHSDILSSRGSISAYFEPKKWEARLLELRLRDHLKAICQFIRIDRSEAMRLLSITIYSDNIVAYNCDFL